MINDFCKFIRDIHADPSAIVPEHTLGDLMSLKEHVKRCDVCDSLVSDVLAKAPPPTLTDSLGMN